MSDCDPFETLMQQTQSILTIGPLSMMCFIQMIHKISQVGGRNKGLSKAVTKIGICVR